MERLTTTPFGQRTLSPTLVEQLLASNEFDSLTREEKWPLFRELCTARTRFGLTDRDMTVLSALLTFHQPASLSSDLPMVVFPSNKTLAIRANGMAESTLRRHLATLIRSGFLRRHDSPNGKRYARKTRQGVILAAFGFDLAPLLERATEIRDAAAEIQEEQTRYKLSKDKIALLKRDAIKLSNYGAETLPDLEWDCVQSQLLEFHKASRRKLSLHQLDLMAEKITEILARIQSMLDLKTQKMSANDGQNERHYQKSNTESLSVKSDTVPQQVTPNIVPLDWLRTATPDIVPYSQNKLTTWNELHRTANAVIGMVGIKKDTWENAQESMGTTHASIVVACILQRIESIRNPSAYLRTLTAQAREGNFSSVSMVMALLNKHSDKTGVDSCQLSTQH